MAEPLTVACPQCNAAVPITDEEIRSLNASLNGRLSWKSRRRPRKAKPKPTRSPGRPALRMPCPRCGVKCESATAAKAHCRQKRKAQ